MTIMFLPTPAEIVAHCSTIQAGWSDGERQRRMRGQTRTKLIRQLNLLGRRSALRRLSRWFPMV